MHGVAASMEIVVNYESFCADPQSVFNASGAKAYIIPLGGTGLYSKERFAEHGVRLNFIKTLSGRYKHFSDEFDSGPLIIGVLVFNEPDRYTEHC